MADLLESVKRVTRATRQRHDNRQGMQVGGGMDAMMPRHRLHGLELEDLNLIVDRHHGDGDMEGYHRGLQEGYASGERRERMLVGEQIQAAGGELAAKLSNTIEELREVLGEKPSGDNGRDRRSRDEIRQGAEVTLDGAREVLMVLWRLAEVTVPGD